MQIFHLYDFKNRVINITPRRRLPSDSISNSNPSAASLVPSSSFSRWPPSPATWSSSSTKICCCEELPPVALFSGLPSLLFRRPAPVQPPSPAQLLFPTGPAAIGHLRAALHSCRIFLLRPRKASPAASFFFELQVSGGPLAASRTLLSSPLHRRLWWELFSAVKNQPDNWVPSSRSHSKLPAGTPVAIALYTGDHR